MGGTRRYASLRRNTGHCQTHPPSGLAEGDDTTIFGIQGPACERPAASLVLGWIRAGMAATLLPQGLCTSVVSIMSLRTERPLETSQLLLSPHGYSPC